MFRIARFQFSLNILEYKNLPFMFSAGLIVLCIVLVLFGFNEGRGRLKKFLSVFTILFKIRQALTPKVKVRHGDESTNVDLQNLFDK